MPCVLTSNCAVCTSTLKSFFKRLILVAVIQLIGWFLFTSIEEGFSLTECIFNRRRIENLIKPKTAKINITNINFGVYLKLYQILNGSLTKQNFEIYNEEFKKYFGVKVPKAENTSVGEICTKWYLFTAITLTTVGYGNVVPKTNAGKYLFFPYCLVGIPAMLFFLAHIGKMLSALSRAIVTKISCKTSSEEDIRHKELKAFVLNFLFLWGWIVIEAVQTHLRAGSNLTFVDGIYFFFVSFTTIGYGDITSPMKQVLFEFRLYVGLSLMSGAVNSFQDIYQNSNPVRSMRRKVKCSSCVTHSGQVSTAENDERTVVEKGDTLSNGREHSLCEKNDIKKI